MFQFLEFVSKQKPFEGRDEAEDWIKLKFDEAKQENEDGWEDLDNSKQFLTHFDYEVITIKEVERTHKLKSRFNCDYKSS